jgi:hypothetical protein
MPSEGPASVSRIARRLVAAGLALAIAAGASAQTDDGEINRDLLNVIALEGLHCGEVTRHLRKSEDHYLAYCRNGRTYAVRVVAGGRVSVTDTADAFAGATGRDLEHDHHVSRGLLSIVNLSGADCDSVVGFRRQGAMDHLAVCQNGKQYRVYVTPLGRVAVDEQGAR